MTMTMGGITIDCADPQKLAEFWTAALDYKVNHGYDAFIFLGPREGDGPYLGLQRATEPRAGKNRVHIDFRSADREAEVARLVALGAVAHEEYDVSVAQWTVLTDPEGNVFCVGDSTI